MARNACGFTRPASDRNVGGRYSAANAGFTLLEVLVSLLIFGLIAGAGVSVMAYAASNQGVVGARMDRLGEFQRARGVLKSDLSQVALRRTRRSDGSPARDVFVGRRPGESGPLFAFVRHGWENPEGDPRASLQYVEYRIVDGQLERSARDALDGAAQGTPRVLLSGIRSAQVAYLERGAWNDGWHGGAEALPAAIELDLQLDGIGRVRQHFLLPGDRS
jgi:general secretion pathway protein J